MRKFEIVDEPFRNYKDIDIKLPVRADKGSAGYDFYSPIDFNILPHQAVLFKTDIKVKMEENEVLLLFVRSSIGIKRHIMITNGTGVIDSTYYGNKENDGNISFALFNFGEEQQIIKRGDRLIQGIFVNYLITDNDRTILQNRKGGIGSSGC